MQAIVRLQRGSKSYERRNKTEKTLETYKQNKKLFEKNF